jgi:uncharacterized protein YjiS (DUF1127 family)
MVSSTVARTHSGAPFFDLALVRAKATHKALRQALQRWHERGLGRRELRRLTERELRDIGLTRAEAEAEASKPFWQA